MLLKDILKEFKFECQIRKMSPRNIKGYINNNILLFNFCEKEFAANELQYIKMEAEKGMDCLGEFSDPVHGYAEQVFYHDFPTNNGEVSVTLFNEALCGNGLGISVKYNKKQLPCFIEWKQVGEGDYVVGLEPATWYPEGRREARKRGELMLIEPGEKMKFDIELGIKEG